VAIAEEPPGRLSFGQHRCLLLAEGLLRAREAGARSLSERVDAVVRCFAVHGLRVGALHLNPGSAGIEWTHGPERAAIAASGSPLGTAVTRGAPRPSPSGPLDLAVRLGRRVAARAVHHAGRCTWIAPIARHGSAARRRAEALPADLYAGAAGVALFLAELHAVTHDRAAKTVALGAMHHALDAVREPGSRSRGLFAGPLGVALAGARTGWLLEEPALIERAAAAARRHRRPPADSRGLDLMGGAAGDVVALLALSAMLGDRTLAEAAVEVGDALASRASSALRRDRRGLGSPLHTRASPAPPVGANGGGPAPGGGFAHGAAGVGCALLELFAWTRNARHAAVAARIFDAGRRWLEVPPRDGASLRRNATTRPPTDPQVAAGWCRGTAGVGLSRLRVRELDGSRAAGAEAVIALRRTVAALRANVGVGRGDFSLCHGLTGLAAALLEGVRVLGVSRPAVRAVNGLVDAALALERRGEPWPCAAEAEHPGLMNGLAGIGWFHLRLGRPGIPSMLLVRPEVWGPGRAAGLGPPSAGRAVPSAAGQARIGERQGSPVLHPAGRRPARSTLTPAPPA
jgi:lantibiotic modifying enzyme